MTITTAIGVLTAAILQESIVMETVLALFRYANGFFAFSPTLKVYCRACSLLLVEGLFVYVVCPSYADPLKQSLVENCLLMSSTREV